MIGYKIDILDALNKKGFTSYKLRKDKIIGERTIQQLRSNQLASWATIDTICRLLNCQPGDILEYKEEG
jgi:putative transcriptional regulator